MSLSIFKYTLAVAAMVLIGFNAGWLTALGVFLALWCNNLAHSVRNLE